MVSDSVKKILEAEKNGEQKTAYAEKKAEEIIDKANLSAKEILQNAREEAAKEAAGLNRRAAFRGADAGNGESLFPTNSGNQTLRSAFFQRAPERCAYPGDKAAPVPR